MSKLAIIAVNYKGHQDTMEWIRSFKKQKNYQIYVIDNSPEPEEFEKMKNVQVVRAENNGYAHGVNVGIKMAINDGFTSFVCMNNDTEVSADFVKNALTSIHKYPKSLIGGKIYYYKGYEYHAKRYRKSDLGKVLWYAGGILDWDNAFTEHRGVDEVDTGKYDTFEETEFVTGCLMCFDKQFVDAVGYMDESYFLYYEDADWSERAKKLGLKLYYDPSIKIWHKNSQSTDGSGSDLHQEYQNKNRVKFGLKYAPLRTKLHLLKNSIL